MSYVFCPDCAVLHDAKAMVQGRCLPCYRVHNHTEPLRAEIDELNRFIHWLYDNCMSGGVWENLDELKQEFQEGFGPNNN